MKHISILGSTGSIGVQALEVIRKYPQEFCVDALAAHSNVNILMQQILEFEPRLVAVYEEQKAWELRGYLQDANKLGTIEVVSGMDGLRAVASCEESEILITSVVGMVGLLPTMDAIRRGKRIALANKETLVTAGELVMKASKTYDAQILPVDSEHSAIFQCLSGERFEDIDELIITASGGPFRGLDKNQIQSKTYREALQHPNWSMGKKITIDSATLMNKGLEVIEARWLFDLPPEKIQVLIHPQSVIHSMVRFVDGSVKAQLGVPSMKLPILYAMTYPQRYIFTEEKLDFLTFSHFDFEKPDLDSFPCLDLAYQALRQGGSCLSVLNGANEVLVNGFLKGEIGFYEISDIIEEALGKYENIAKPSLEEVLEADRWARDFVCSKMKKISR